MSGKRRVHLYKPGDVYRLEQDLNALSAQGLQPKRLGALVQRLTPRTGPAMVYRVGYCDGRPGAAKEITYLSSQQRRGWQLVGRRRGWLLFAKPADQAQEDERLEQDRQPIAQCYKRRIKARESLRMVLLVLATALLLVGYMMDIVYIIYSFAVPMLICVLLTLEIKYMEEGLLH